jgi:hypothetical protein
MINSFMHLFTSCVKVCFVMLSKKFCLEITSCYQRVVSLAGGVYCA